MLHLSAERLAALRDDPPTAEELAHLAGCADCARERRAFGALHALADAEHARLGTPLTDWNALAPRLRADGVIDTGTSIVARRRLPVRWLQVAAGLLLVAGGAMLGRLSAHQPPFPAPSTIDAPSKTVASAAADTTFESAARAQQVRDSAAALYQQAVAYLAKQDSTSTSTTPAAIRTRLAALDHVSETMRQALQLAPGDPVINGYYLTTLGQREATIRQLNTALPAGLRMQSF